MSEQVHRRLADEQVRMILGRYAAKELTAAQAMELMIYRLSSWRLPYYIGRIFSAIAPRPSLHGR